MWRLIDEVVLDDDERSLSSTMPPLPDPRQAARAVYDAVAGFGPLQRHLDEPDVEELWINEPGRVFVALRGRSGPTTTILDDGQVRDLVEKMVTSTGRRVDLSTPCAQRSRHAHCQGRDRRVAGRRSTSHFERPISAQQPAGATHNRTRPRPVSGCLVPWVRIRSPL